MNRIFVLIVLFFSSQAFSLDWDNDEERKAFGRSTWVSKISRDLKCARLLKSEDHIQAHNFYIERIEQNKELMAKEMFGYTDSEIKSIVKDGEKDARKRSNKLYNKETCLKMYSFVEEMFNTKPRERAPGTCILGSGVTDTFEMPREILEGATDFKVVDGFKEFTLPEGYTTDNGTRVHLKEEVMIYKAGQREDKKVFLKEIDGKIHVREEDYIMLDNKSMCIESSFTVG